MKTQKVAFIVYTVRQRALSPPNISTGWAREIATASRTQQDPSLIGGPGNVVEG